MQEGQTARAPAPRRPGRKALHPGARAEADSSQSSHSLTSDTFHRCCNTHFEKAEHGKAGDFLLDIVTIMIETSRQTIPMSGGVTGGPGKASRAELPGRSSEVDPYRLEYVRCHKVWREKIRPRNREVHEAMVKSRTG